MSINPLVVSFQTVVLCLTLRNVAGNQYLTGLTLYFIGYVLFEVISPTEMFFRVRLTLSLEQIPCNIILKRTSPRLWLPTLTIAWGIVATLMGVVHNLAGFFVARLFLGSEKMSKGPFIYFRTRLTWVIVTESGLFPGVVFYFSMWYRRRERQFRISLFFSAAALAGSFGGILAYVYPPYSLRNHSFDHSEHRLTKYRESGS